MNKLLRSFVVLAFFPGLVATTSLSAVAIEPAVVATIEHR